MNRLIDAALLSSATLFLAAIAPQAEAAQVREVSFESQSETLVGNLYLPDDYVAGQELPGIVVTGSWTSVKEQMSGLYAEELADRGFAALAFDFRNFGESGGDIRALESPAMKVEDITAAAAFLPTLPEVADHQIGGWQSVPQPVIWPMPLLTVLLFTPSPPWRPGCIMPKPLAPFTALNATTA